MSGAIGENLIPRVPFEEFAADLKASLRPKVERLGYCGEIWQVGANAPKSMYHFCELTEALKEEMDQKLVELVALTAAGVMGNTYELNQHERLAEKLGYGREWIAQVNALQPEPGKRMTDVECAVQRFVMAAIYRRGHHSAELFEEVARAVGPRNAIGILLSTGRCVMHALFCNTLALSPPVPSIFSGGQTA
ncbi:MAG TPA: carboxymuconolactone decarboxylase family protein [Myxococcaceae bacterium]|nr:carboxymuconolactone decarboxylase family protein [Myxococcaceae bacterium]